MLEALHETPEKPFGFVDVIDWRRPIDPKNPRDFVWLAQTDTFLSMGVVIDNGKAVIAALNKPHIIGINEQEAEVSISDLMDPDHAREIARNCVMRWMQGKGYERIIERETRLVLGKKNPNAPVDLRHDRKSQPLITRLAQSGIPFHVFHALLWAGNSRLSFPYMRSFIDE